MGRTHLLVVAVLAILQPANAFLPWLRRQKQQQHHRLFRTLLSTDRSGRGSKIVLTSSLGALEDNKSEYKNNNNNDSILKTETEWSQISSLSVETLNGDTATLGDIMSNNSTVVLSCLSHFGDYNAWEMTQQYMSAIQSGRLSEDCPVVLVGIGSVEAANTFATDIGLSSGFKDRLTLVTDETGKVTEALDCYRGWLTIDKKHKERYPFTDVPPAVKLLGMIAGFGSPGTIEKVLQGYTGDVTNNHGLFGRQWVIQALQQGGDKGRFPKVDVSLDPQSDLKPFELATLRLQTGLHIVAKWGKLGPKDGDLITRMGGTFVFDKQQQCVYEHFDQGILNFANMDDICLVTEAALKGEQYVVPSNKAQAKKNRQELWARKDKESKVRLQEAAERAKEAQREAERLAREAKLAEEARLEELDRIEAERIAEMARQGEEAKQSRQAEMEAEAKAKVEEEDKLRIAEIEAEAKAKEDAERILEAAALEAKLIATKEDETAKEAAQEAEVLDKIESMSASLESDPVEDDFDVTVDEILRRAEEQEMKIRASLEAIQNIQKASAKDSQEKFQRSLLAARIQYEKDKQILPGMIINGASAPTGAIPEVPSKPISSNLQKTSSSQQEAFQRKLLAAQFQYGEGSSNKSSTEESIENLHDQKDYEATEQQKAFQRELLAARIHYDKAAAGKSQPQVVISTVDSLPNLGTVAAKYGSKNGPNNGKDEEELFQRKLLATRLKYEVSNGKIRSTASTSTSKPTTLSIAQDQELL
ncbi:AhpC/TSA antioxidant enzyme [Nitzschia inconspicua]|uniref:AhpC/TSA antioxidant enzyme n=1 Tax=Nitzschia inconspicua TaxID=303405 RepID=A0A9K3L8H7_9STRA|nr:AhpC/TSA antioxidant enzyme [Nitzschia inconspicua]